MSKRRIARRQIADAHLSSTDRGARLLAASGGDLEHAERIDGVLDDLRAHGSAPADFISEDGGNVGRSAPVISLPRPYDRELEQELEVEAVANVLGWWPATLLGLAAWFSLFGVAWSIYLVVEAVT